MNYQPYVGALAALAHADRLAVFRLLARRAPDGVRPSDIAEALGLKPNTLSGHVRALLDAGLARTWREGKSVFYGIELAAVGDLVEFIAADCCRGRPEVCAPIGARMLGCAASPALPPSTPPYRTIFICTGNYARSIFAEAILGAAGGSDFIAQSAGTRPANGVNPFAADVLREEGLDASRFAPQGLEALQGDQGPAFDFVITVCDQAANEDCPPWPGRALTAHWGVPDPAAATGDAHAKVRAFRSAYEDMRRRIEAFVALPFATLDHMTLQKRLDDIGRYDFESSLESET